MNALATIQKTFTTVKSAVAARRTTPAPVAAETSSPAVGLDTLRDARYIVCKVTSYLGCPAWNWHSLHACASREELVDYVGRHGLADCQVIEPLAPGAAVQECVMIEPVVNRFDASAPVHYNLQPRFAFEVERHILQHGIGGMLLGRRVKVDVKMTDRLSVQVA